MKYYKLTILLTMLFSMAGVRVFAAEIGGVYYYFSGENAIVTHHEMAEWNTDISYKYKGTVTIPSTIQYKGKTYKVTSIGERAFYKCKELYNISIPSSVTTIEKDAFSSCDYLKKVIISDIAAWCKARVESNPLSYAHHIYSNENTEITKLVIPNSVTEIKNFQGCSSIESITIPNSVKKIDKYAFHNCSGLKSLNLPNSLTSIADYAFQNCSGLKSLNLPNSLTSIADYAFESCSSLESVLIPSSVTSIGLSAFAGCKALKSITIPNSVKTFGSSVFDQCYGLVNANIQCSDIPERTFRACTSLISVTISTNVRNIGSNAFSACKSLTSITIPKNVTSIGDDAFSACKLTSLEIGTPNVPSFSNMESLSKLVLLDGAKIIGDNAFKGCTGLKSISISNSLTTIGKNAFQGCSSLSSITIPKGVTGIAATAFDGCSLNSVEIGCETVPSCFSSMKSLKSVVLLDGVKSIGNSAFKDCSNLTKITLPNSITSIRGSSFSGCTKLTNIVLSGELTTIGESAFYGCTKLTNITLPEKLTIICRSAFQGCGLNSVNMPASVSNIEEDAFYNCLSLKKVVIQDISAWCKTSLENSWSNPLSQAHHLYSANNTIVKELVIPDDVRIINKYAFIDCTDLTVIKIPNTVVEIGASVFSGCTGITSVIVPGNMKSIGDYAFSGCSGMKSVTIQGNLEKMGKNMFKGCILSSLTFEPTVNAIIDTISTKKAIWMTNTPPKGYENVKADVNYVANNQYTSLKNVKVYPFISSLFEVDGVKYVPVSPSEKTCDAIDGNYDASTSSIVIGKDVAYKGVSMTVKEVCPYTFYGNNSIKTANLSFDGKIGEYAFFNCTNLQTVEVANTGNVGSYVFSECTGLKEVKAKNTGNLGDYAFYKCTNLQKAEISNTGNIGNYAFYKCPKLQNAEISNTGSIGNYAFSECTNMNNVRIEIGGTIGNYAFYKSGLQKLNVIKSGDIGEYAFGSITSSFSAQINSNGAIKANAFNGCTFMQEVTLSAITSIGNNAFYGCSRLSSITIPNSVKQLGSQMFSGCTGLQIASIGNGVSSIPDYAFKGCSSLTDVKIGSNVQTIGTYAFSGCSKLPNIEIPASVTAVNDYAFDGCSVLKKVIMNDGKSALKLGANGSNPLFASCPLDTVYIGRNISYDATSAKGYSPFYRNTSLRAVEITDKETEISENEFYGCSNLKNVRIGDGVTTIGNWAFSGCASLDYFAFGRKVKTIGNESFSDCTNVTHLISRAPVPPVCGSQALDDINKWSCTLTVPQGCTTAYQAAPQWKEFFFMEEGEAIITPDEKVTVEMPASGYATFYNSVGSYALPTGLLAKVVTGVAGNKITYETIADGSMNKCIVPAGVPVMLEYKSRQGGTYTLTLSEREDEYTGANLLEGSDVAMKVAPADDECAYKLSYGPSNSEYSKVFGWYWGATNGAGFEIGAHKAWLKVKKASAARSYAIDGEALGIENHACEVAKPQICYDLQGRRVEMPTRKGLYIVNGKKMIRK